MSVPSRGLPDKPTAPATSSMAKCGRLAACALLIGVLPACTDDPTELSGGSDAGADAARDAAVDGDASLPDAGSYVPEPNPISGPYEIGAYYMPKLRVRSYFWRLIEVYNQDPDVSRMPLLGIYDGGEPEVLDWQIKWAVEHGLSFWIFDWYWVAGRDQPVMNESLDAFLASQYRSFLPFAVALANVPTSGDPDGLRTELEDILAFWMDNYFELPEYLTIDGKPVVDILFPWALNDQLGGDSQSQDWQPLVNALQNLESRLVDDPRFPEGWFLIWGDFWPSRGLDGPALVPPDMFAQAGFDAMTDYGCPGLINPVSHTVEVEVDYPTFVDRCGDYWSQAIDWIQAGQHGQLLLPLSTAQDNSANYGGVWGGIDSPRTTNPTIEGLIQQMNLAAQLAEAHGAEVVSKADKPLLLVKEWNGWPEASDIEPGSHEWFAGTEHEDLPFAYADAIREFLLGSAEPHADLTPADLAMGPYPARPAVSVPVWEFESPEDGADWYVQLTASPFEVWGGVARTRLNGQLGGTPSLGALAAVDFDASSYCKAETRLKACRLDATGACTTSPNATTGTLVWHTDDKREGSSGGGLGVSMDNQYYDREIILEDVPDWTGRVIELILVMRPVQPDDYPLQISIDYLRLACD